MQSQLPRFPAVPRGVACALLALLMLALPARPASAQDFDVRTASLGLADGSWCLTARIDYQLTRKALEALDNGVALTFRVELSASRVRRWLPNPEVLAVQRDWQLSYEPLTKRYIVAYPDGRESTSHGTLFGALNALGRVQALPVAAANELAPGEAYAVAVRAVLDQQTLPGPLQVLAFWDSGFSLASDWYEWTMKP
jgi:hypothetical protein